MQRDIALLNQCSLGNKRSLSRFEDRYEYVVSQCVDEYLGIIESSGRDGLKVKFKGEIFSHATTIPKFRRSLELEIRSFVTQSCVRFLYETYKVARKVARAERG